MRAAFLLLLVLAGCSKIVGKGEEAGLSAAEVSREAKKLSLAPGQWRTTTTITAIDIPGVPSEAIVASPACWTSHSNPMPVASRTPLVASASSGPIPSPGIRVTV